MAVGEAVGGLLKMKPRSLGRGYPELSYLGMVIWGKASADPPCNRPRAAPSSGPVQPVPGVSNWFARSLWACSSCLLFPPAWEKVKGLRNSSLTPQAL